MCSPRFAEFSINMCLFWARVILPVWSCVWIAHLPTGLLGCLLTWCKTVCVALWLWLYFLMCVIHFFCVPASIPLAEPVQKHNTWISNQPVKETNELNKPALCCCKQKQIPTHTLLHICSIDWCMWGFQEQWRNTCPVFISTRAFSMQVKVVCDWLLLDWNVLHVSPIKEEKHIHMLKHHRYSHKREMKGCLHLCWDETRMFQWMSQNVFCMCMSLTWYPLAFMTL